MLILSRVSRSLPNSARLSLRQFLPDDAVLKPNQLATNFYQSTGTLCFLTNPTPQVSSDDTFRTIVDKAQVFTHIPKAPALSSHPNYRYTNIPTHPNTNTPSHRARWPSMRSKRQWSRQQAWSTGPRRKSTCRRSFLPYAKPPPQGYFAHFFPRGITQICVTHLKCIRECVM